MDNSRIRLTLKGKRAVVTKSTIVQAVRALSQDSTVSLLAPVQEIANWAYTHYTSEVTTTQVVVRIVWSDSLHKEQLTSDIPSLSKSERVISLHNWDSLDSLSILNEFIALIRSTPFVEISSNKSIDDFI